MAKKKAKRKDPRVEKEYWDEMEITDPVTGEKSIHRVKITQYKAIKAKPVGNKGIVGLDDEGFPLED